MDINETKRVIEVFEVHLKFLNLNLLKFDEM